MGPGREAYRAALRVCLLSPAFSSRPAEEAGTVNQRQESRRAQQQNGTTTPSDGTTKLGREHVRTELSTRVHDDGRSELGHR
jgi:hypothetical protein